MDYIILYGRIRKYILELRTMIFCKNTTGTLVHTYDVYNIIFSQSSHREELTYPEECRSGNIRLRIWQQRLKQGRKNSRINGRRIDQQNGRRRINTDFSLTCQQGIDFKTISKLHELIALVPFLFFILSMSTFFRQKALPA
jgi:hypothetical protein